MGVELWLYGKNSEDRERYSISESGLSKLDFKKCSLVVSEMNKKIKQNQKNIFKRYLDSLNNFR